MFKRFIMINKRKKFGSKYFVFELSERKKPFNYRFAHYLDTI